MPKKGQQQVSFSALNLDHKGTRERVRACLAAIKSQDVFDRADLDRICGQRNKPLGQLLRCLFVQQPEIVAKKNGEGILYKSVEPRVQQLQNNLNGWDWTDAEANALKYQIEQEQLKSKLRFDEMFKPVDAKTWRLNKSK